MPADHPYCAVLPWTINDFFLAGHSQHLYYNGQKLIAVEKMLPGDELYYAAPTGERSEALTKYGYGDLVSIIAFSFAFGASSGATLWTAISGIDAMQEESGLALGYTKSQTFRRIIFPQALQQCLTQLLGQFVSLVKDTSVVGFIAVMDLTRAGDLIRARTLDAFFPLLSIAMIYFVVCRILLWIIKKITNQITNKHRTIKGIKL